MKFLILLSFSLSFFVTTTLLAAPIGEVIKIRGDATQLPPNAMLAKKIQLGDKLIEDTSILTSSKSFVKIKLIDNSELNIGPDSKIVLTELRKDEPGVISLLKGRIRTEVEKDQAKNENKFFIKTRSAALGVRGTDFQTIYNPESKTTSLLTFKGEVAMAKVEEKAILEVAKENIKENISELNAKLASKEAVVVPPGQSSFTSDAIVKSSLPVKISPVQLTALYKNQEFLTKTETVTADKSSFKTDELKIAEQKAPAEGLVNKATGDFAPKSGGFIDLETGIYVAPDSKAVLDKKNNVYVSNQIGNIDKKTGEYAPPEGLVLDAKKGFVVDSNQGSKTKELTALKNDLNKTVMTDTAQAAVKITEKKAVEKKVEVLEAPYNINEKFAKEEFAISLRSQTQEITLNENSHNQAYYSMRNNKYMSIDLHAETESKNRYRAIYNLSYGHNKYNGKLPSNISEDSGSLFSMNGGLKFALNKNYDLYSTIGFFQEQFAAQTSSTYPTSFALTRIVLTKISAGANAQFYRDQKYSLDLNFELYKSFRKRLNTIVVEDGSGSLLAITPKYLFKANTWFAAGLSFSSANQNIITSYGSNQQHRNNAGLEFKYIFLK